MTARTELDALTELLRRYRLRLESVAPGGGTAGRAWRVRADGRDWFVRRRGARTSSPERLRFDHGLRRFLAPRGPYVTPALPNDSGEAWTRLADGVYEVYPWVDGLAFSPAFAAPARLAAARVLAWYHREAGAYPAPCEPRLPQFGHYPVPPPARPAFDDPAALLEAADWVARTYGTTATRGDLDRMRRRLEWLAGAYGPLRDALPRTVIHGDFNHCNLLYSATGGVVGLFDFDWAWRDVRVRDVGDGMLFFGARRAEVPDAGDIWSLTACPELDTEGMLAFVRACHAGLPLSPEEWRAVPLAMLGRWAAIRLEGVLKVPEARRAEFALAGFEKPFAWYEAAAPTFASAVA